MRLFGLWAIQLHRQLRRLRHRTLRIPTDFYPASGYRASGSGGLHNVGAGGYAWSSSPSSASSVYGSGLGFDGSGVGPENGDNRSNGFPVRCVQE